MSSFDSEIDWEGKSMKKKTLSYKTFDLTIDKAVKQLGLCSSDFIKLDVDGIEHFILMSGLGVLSSVKSVLVEVNDNVHQHAHKIHTVLESSGLTLGEKTHSEMIDEGPMNSVYN